MGELSHRAPEPRWRKGLVTLAALAMVVTTGRLGLWQLDRAQLKERQSAQEVSQRMAPPLNASELITQSTADEGSHPVIHRRARVTGRWLEGSVLYLENRPLDGAPGFIVLTLLELQPGLGVLVQRGWQPRDRADPLRVTPPDASSARAVRLEARVTPPPSRLMELKAGAQGSIRHNIDMSALSTEFGIQLLPVSLQQGKPAQVCDEGVGTSMAALEEADCESVIEDDLVRRWVVVASDPAKNRGYAVQWFALSALTAGLWVWFQFIQPRRRRHVD